MKKEYFIGDRKFYRMVMTVALPMMLQNGITNVVGLLDNVMVGKLGTEQMSGVSIINQLVFVFFLCLFGAVGGAGIFTAQFYGQGNTKGVRDTFRFKIILGVVISALAAAILYFLQDTFISMYLHETEGSTEDLALTLEYGKQYLAVILIGVLPVAIEQAYSSTLRECGETVVPMFASFASVFVNLLFNYILIYGKFGAPALGVVGAAIATNIARFLQMLIVVIWTHMHTERAQFARDAYKGFSVPMSLVGKILVMAAPLILNETLWAAGIVRQNQVYSLRGLSVVAALNINSAIYNVFNIVFIALGNSVGIIAGQHLGAKEFEKAKEAAYRIITFSFVASIIIGGLMFATAPLFPKLYKTSDEIKSLATSIMRVSGMMMPIAGLLHATYFTIRSGGKTVITFLFDSVFLWVISVPLALVLTKFTALDIVMIFFIVSMMDFVKFVIGFFIMKSGVWMNNIVEKV